MEAARLTRNKLVSARTPPLEANMVIFRSISGPVHCNGVNFARALLATTTVASEFLEISDDNIVSLSRPMNFERQCEQLQRDLVQDRVNRAESVLKDSPVYAEKKRIRAHVRAERRRAKMWAPKGKSLPLQAVVDSARGEVLVSSADMVSSLRSHWAPVFAPRSTSQRHLDQYLGKHMHAFD
eukprot:9486035-Pyramimonas_sp.AAC.1